MNFKFFQDKRNLIICITSVLIAITLVLFKYHNVLQTAINHQAPQVSVMKLQAQDIELQYEYFGKAAGSLEIDVKARVDGVLKKKAYQEGQFVKQGDLLFTIETEVYEAKFSQAQSKLKAQEANLLKTENEWKRIAELYKSKISSAHDKDQAYADYEQAKAAVEQAKADLKVATIQLSYTNVTAPISGLAGKETVSEGTLLGNQLGYVTLTNIVQMDPLFINFAFSDSDKSYLQQMIDKGIVTLPEDKKLRAIIKSADGKVLPTEAIVDFTDNIINAKNGTVQARAVIANADHFLIPGQFVNIEIKGALRKNTIVISQQAVMHGPMGTFVYVVDAENKASIKPITLGPRFANTQIIESGLQIGDQIITEGMIKVQPNQPVKIVQAGADGAQNAQQGSKN